MPDAGVELHIMLIISGTRNHNELKPIMKVKPHYLEPNRDWFNGELKLKEHLGIVIVRTWRGCSENIRGMLSIACGCSELKSQ